MALLLLSSSPLLQSRRFKNEYIQCACGVLSFSGGWSLKFGCMEPELEVGAPPHRFRRRIELCFFKQIKRTMDEQLKKKKVTHSSLFSKWPTTPTTPLNRLQSSAETAASHLGFVQVKIKAKLSVQQNQRLVDFLLCFLCRDGKIRSGEIFLFSTQPRLGREAEFFSRTRRGFRSFWVEAGRHREGHQHSGIAGHLGNSEPVWC